MLGITTEKKLQRVAKAAYSSGLIEGLKIAAIVVFFLIVFCFPGEAQFAWPTYPVNTPTQQYKIMVDNGSGVAILATGKTTNFLGVTQNAVVTSTGKVALQPLGPTLIQVGSSSVSMGEFVTSDANANATAITLVSGGCILGTVIGLNGGSGAANSFVYVNVLPFCVNTGSSGTVVSSFFGNTGAITALSDPTNIIDASGNFVDYTTAGITIGDALGDSVQMTAGTTVLKDEAGDSCTLTAGAFTCSPSIPQPPPVYNSYTGSGAIATAGTDYLNDAGGATFTLAAGTQGATVNIINNSERSVTNVVTFSSDNPTVYHQISCAGPFTTAGFPGVILTMTQQGWAIMAISSACTLS